VFFRSSFEFFDRFSKEVLRHFQEPKVEMSFPVFLLDPQTLFVVELSLIKQAHILIALARVKIVLGEVIVGLALLSVFGLDRHLYIVEAPIEVVHVHVAATTPQKPLREF
jgi:hypothetical protein